MSDFWELAKTAAAKPTQADFAALRTAYVESDAYRPAKHIMQSKLMQITDRAQGFEEVAATCQDILTGNPMDLEARLMLAFAQEKLGENAAAANSTAFANAMLDAILATGDGKSMDTAFQVVAEAEVWTIMKVFEMRTAGHTRHQATDHTIDVFTGKIGEREVEMFFNVTRYVNAINELISSE